jgi:hypothetical protein
MATFIAPLSVDAVDGIKPLKCQIPNINSLTNRFFYAIEVSRKAVQQAGWSSNDVLESTWVPLVVQQIYLKTLSEYLKLAKHKLWLLQPRLWKISSWVAHDLQSSGPEFHIQLPVRQLYMRF